jgi:hypothetical protein
MKAMVHLVLDSLTFCGEKDRLQDLSACLVLFNFLARREATFELMWAEAHALATIGPHCGIWAQLDSKRKKAGRGISVETVMRSGT